MQLLSILGAYTAVKKPVTDTPSNYKPINIRMPLGLLDLIDQAAAASGQDRSNWIRSACSAKLQGADQPHPSKDDKLVEDLKVVDPRARAVVKDLLLRVERLEAATFGEGEDPFSDQTP